MTAEFSVVIPLFNKRDYVLRAVASAVSQRPRPAEVIVVDDGSTDGGGTLVAESFPQVRLIRQDNQGVGAARNKGIASAQAGWVALLDADDFWLPGHLEELERIVTSVPEARLISTQYQEVRESDDFRVTRLPPGRVRGIDYFREASKNMGVVWSSCVALRRSVPDDLGGFGPTITGEDTEMWARIALKFPIAISEAQTAFYVRGVGGVMETEGMWHKRFESSHLPAVEFLRSHPAYQAVVAALSRNDLPVPKRSLQLYLNAWRLRMIRQSLVQGDGASACALRRELSSPMQITWVGTLALTFLPTGFLVRVLNRRRALGGIRTLWAGRIRGLIRARSEKR